MLLPWMPPLMHVCAPHPTYPPAVQGKPLGKGKFSLGNALDYSNKFNLKCNMHTETLQVRHSYMSRPLLGLRCSRRHH